MTQAQKIINELVKDKTLHLSFGDLHERLPDMPKGTLSALLVSMAKDGLISRQVREVKNGRDVHEYAVTDDGEQWLSVQKEKPPRKPRKARAASRQPLPASFTEVQKLAEHKDEYDSLHKFVQYLDEKDVLKKTKDPNSALLEYLGVNPGEFEQQKKSLDSILSR